MLPGRKFSPDHLLRALQRRWWMLALPMFVCTFGALLVSRFLPNRYQSETLIQIVPQRVPDSYVRSTVTTDIEERLEVDHAADHEPDAHRGADHETRSLPRRARRRCRWRTSSA